MKDIKFDFNDILIKPVPKTDISSRSEINPFDKNGFLPLITAPMDTVVNSDNAHVFEDSKINVCLPRGEERTNINMFESYSLVQFVEKFLGNEGQKFFPINELPLYVLIDTANGHIFDLQKVTKSAKELYGDTMILMVGNVANPETYRLLSDAGADYIRVGIGNGGGCLTTQQLGIGYPMASLIQECYYVSLSLDKPAKIVADGGMKDYSDIIKALAIGADYVMVGSIFNKTLESSGPCLSKHGDNYNVLSDDIARAHLDNGQSIYKMFRGMSTKEVQKEWGVEKPKTSEGIVKYQEVEYTIGGWVENFESYLRSAMSYTNSRTLEDFCGEVELIRITENALNRFKK